MFILFTLSVTAREQIQVNEGNVDLMVFLAIYCR